MEHSSNNPIDLTAEAAYQAPAIGAQPPVQKPYCEVCDMPFASARNYKAHLETASHKARANGEQPRKRKERPGSEESSDSDSESDEKGVNRKKPAATRASGAKRFRMQIKSDSDSDLDDDDDDDDEEKASSGGAAASAALQDFTIGEFLSLVDGKPRFAVANQLLVAKRGAADDAALWNKQVGVTREAMQTTAARQAELEQAHHEAAAARTAAQNELTRREAVAAAARAAAEVAEARANEQREVVDTRNVEIGLANSHLSEHAKYVKRLADQEAASLKGASDAQRRADEAAQALEAFCSRDAANARIVQALCNGDNAELVKTLSANRDTLFTAHAFMSVPDYHNNYAGATVTLNAALPSALRDEQCMICQDPLSNGQHVYETTCQHAYHYECILDMARRDEGNMALMQQQQQLQQQIQHVPQQQARQLQQLLLAGPLVKHFKVACPLCRGPVMFKKGKTHLVRKPAQ